MPGLMRRKDVWGTMMMTGKRLMRCIALVLIVMMVSGTGAFAAATPQAERAASETSETTETAESAGSSETSETSGTYGEPETTEAPAGFTLFQDRYELKTYDPDGLYLEEEPFFPYWIVAKSGTIGRAWSNNYGVVNPVYTEIPDSEWDYVNLVPVGAGDATVSVQSEEGEIIEVPVHIDQQYVDEYYYMPAFRYAAFVAPVYEGESYISGSFNREIFEEDDHWDMPDLGNITITATYDNMDYLATEPDEDGFFTFNGMPEMKWQEEYTVTFRKGEAMYSVTGTVARPLDRVSVEVSDATWSGEELTPSLTVTDDGTTLEEGTDYSVSYEDNVSIGRGKVTLYGLGKYAGDKSATFQIRPIGTTLRKVKRGEGGFTASWEVQDQDIDGYVVQYSRQEDFTGWTRNLTVSDPAADTGSVTGLLAGELYYVRIRTYKTAGEYNYYSDWSEAEQVKTR